ncbi:MAG TPA: DUF4386 family protein [Candidatus Elarobacter sp.]|nr:DUF4386 family protein [Candidatus Elarobacter sp.]
MSRARITGAVYLLYFLTAIFAQSLLGRSAPAYAAAANLVATACYAAVTVLFYQLFRPVSRGISLLAALVSLTGCTVQALAIVHRAPAHAALFFFGCYCILIGYLIFASAFLPRFLGVVMALAGAGWLLFLAPSLPNAVSLSLEALGVLAEAMLMLWLLVAGIDVRRWNEQVVSAR